MQLDFQPQSSSIDFQPAPQVQSTKQVAPTSPLNSLIADPNSPEAKFLKGEITGTNPTADSFGGKLVQDTVGSKGILGVTQLPGKVITSYMTAGADQPVANSAANLAHVSTILLQKANSLPDGDPRKAQLLSTVRGNEKAMGMSEDTLKNLHDAQLTPGEALGTGINAALTLASFGTGSLIEQPAAKALAPVLSKVPIGSTALKLVKLGLTSAESGAIGAGYQAGSNLVEDKPASQGTGSAFAFAASIPVIGSAISKAKELAGNIIGSIGQRIQLGVLRPTQRDLADGFNLANVNKYKVGGSVADTLTKTNEQLDTLSKRLYEVGKEHGSPIDVNDVYAETVKALTANKAQNFGANAKITSALTNLKSELSYVADNGGKVDWTTGQAIKRGAGANGSWSYGMFDPDSKANEIVYNTFYNKMKTALEDAAPTGVVKSLNSQMQDLISINNAAIRRLPATMRESPIGLVDSIALLDALSNVKALGFLAARKVMKSGTAGSFLAEKGAQIADSAAAGSTTAIAKRIFAK